MKQEVRDEIYEELKVLLSKVLEQVEEIAGIKVGKDTAWRQEYIAQGAGVLYAKVVNEAKTMIDDYITGAEARVAKFR